MRQVRGAADELGEARVVEIKSFKGNFLYGPPQVVDVEGVERARAVLEQGVALGEPGIGRTDGIPGIADAVGDVQGISRFLVFRSEAVGRPFHLRIPVRQGRQGAGQPAGGPLAALDAQEMHPGLAPEFHVGAQVDLVEVRHRREGRQVARPDALHGECHHRHPGTVFQPVQVQRLRNERPQGAFIHLPVQEHRPVPLLVIPPGPGWQRPGAMVGLGEEGMGGHGGLG